MSDRQLKTAKELGLTEKEYEALLRVRAKLADGVMRHVRDPEVAGSTKHSDRPVFSMDIDFRHDECGQVGCIGGWMAIEMGLNDAVDFVACTGSKLPLWRLFHPPVHLDWSDLTPKQAVRAIDRFLTGHEYPWGVE